MPSGVAWPLSQQTWLPSAWRTQRLLPTPGGPKSSKRFRCPAAKARREELAALCAGLGLPELLFSTGVVEAGTALYALALAQGHEGVVAKRLASTYRPGRRSPAWRKIKPKEGARCQEG